MTRWLRMTEPKLTLTDRLAVLREIGAATDARDRCLRALGLDQRPEADPLTTLYAQGCLIRMRPRTTAMLKTATQTARPTTNRTIRQTVQPRSR